MRKRSSRCPQCHSTRVVPIEYGDPTKEFAHFGDRERLNRSIVNTWIGIVNTKIGHREHGEGADESELWFSGIPFQSF